MAIISSGDDHVTITGTEGMDDRYWTLEFGVRDGNIYVVQDTGTHLSAELILAAADGLL